MNLSIPLEEHSVRIEMKAHAKINWALNILGLRPNGYHELDMLMQSIELYDGLALETADEISLSVNGGPREKDEKNLVVRAAMALNAYTGKRCGAVMDLVKHIPARAGLGGGSADCAAALVGLNRLWGLDLPMEALLEIGLKLGADVPFCLTGGLARVSGIGENIEPIHGGPVAALAMVTPGDGLSTGAVFQKWDRDCEPVQWDLKPLSDALVRGDLEKADALHFNALTGPAAELLPEIQTAMDEFRTMGADAVFMTGSGSTVVAAFRDEDRAKQAAGSMPGAVFTRTMPELNW